MNRNFRTNWPLLLLLLLSAGSLSQCAVLTAERPWTNNREREGGGERPEREVFVSKDPKRQEVVTYAKQYLGTPYRYAGRDPKRGFDCSGFTLYVMQAFDIDLSPTSRNQANEGRRVDVSSARPGDLVYFKRSPAGKVFHVAMVVSNDRAGLQVIHSTSRGVVIDNISESDYWRPKVAGARNVIN